MAARGRPSKTLYPKPPRVRRVRIHAEAYLTPSEVERLKAKAAAEMRSIAGYVAFLVSEDLRKRGGDRRRRSLRTRKNHQRVTYEVGVSLTPEQRERLEARATNEARSLSNYVTRLILDDLQNA